MRVLFSSRRNLFTAPGGDTVQLVKTAEQLRLLGVHVDINTEDTPNLEGYDLVHLFNLMRPQEIYSQAKNAKLQGKQIALSTIYGLYTEFERKARGGLPGWLAKHLTVWQIERAKVLARIFSSKEAGFGSWLVAFSGYWRICSKTLEMVDICLPNSHSEMQRVQVDFPQTSNMPYVVVPNAADENLFSAVAECESVPLTDFVLCVARIEGRKCQLELVRAMKSIDADLVIIGQAAPNHQKYYEAVKREASFRVHFLGQMSQQDLIKYYSAAKVHALVSWMETPGLSSLEAAAMGCNIVVTEKGDTRDYFGDAAFYCKTNDIGSITNALRRALNSEKKSSLQSKIKAEYSWGNAAEQTLAGYKVVLDC